MMKKWIASAAVLFLCGCNGQVQEYADKAEYPTGPNDPSADGVRAYMPAYMKVTMHYTTRIGDDKKTATTDCDSSHVFAEIQQKCDYSRPLRVVYKHGLFETYTFGVTLGADGCLLGANSQSTPPTASIATFIPAAVTAAAALAPHPGRHPAPQAKCTGDPVMVGAPQRCDDSGNCSVP